MEGAGSYLVEDGCALLLEGGNEDHGTLALRGVHHKVVVANTTHSLNQGRMLLIRSDMTKKGNIRLPGHT